MRHDQPDPADDAADRNGGGRYQRSAKNNNQPQPPGVNAQSPGFFVPQRQHIDFPAQQKQRYQSGRHDQSGKKQGHLPGTGQAAHQPIRNGRQLVRRIGDQLDQRRCRRKQRTDHDPG